MSERVQGKCPMGCGQTLFLGSGGYVTCSSLECPRPEAATLLLEDGESEHVVQLHLDDFTLQHPLRERIVGDLFSCDIHARIAELDGPPREPGRYRITVDPHQHWHGEALA